MCNNYVRRHSIMSWKKNRILIIVINLFMVYKRHKKKQTNKITANKARKYL